MLLGDGGHEADARPVDQLLITTWWTVGKLSWRRNFFWLGLRHSQASLFVFFCTGLHGILARRMNVTECLTKYPISGHFFPKMFLQVGELQLRSALHNALIAFANCCRVFAGYRCQAHVYG